MKLRNWLPTKYLTEENPVIGLSFEVGYARLAVMVGQTVIHTMSNMIRADYDSQIFNCVPAWMYQKRAPYSDIINKHHPMSGGLRRQDTDKFEVHSALTPRHRSYLGPVGDAYLYTGTLQHTGKRLYTEHEFITSELLNLRRKRKLTDSPFLYGDPDHPRQLTNFEIYSKSGSMPNVGTVGHVDHGKVPSYLTSALYEKEMRQAAVEAGFGELDYMQRKLLNNGHSGVPRKESGHSSMTAACRTIPNYRLTDMHGGRGVVVPVYPVAKDIIHQFVGHKAAARLAEKYIFTGEGMLPKGL